MIHTPNPPTLKRDFIFMSMTTNAAAAVIPLHSDEALYHRVYICISNAFIAVTRIHVIHVH